jgi:conjugal transfer/type IV secretion protein DotA/TraY
MKASRILAGLAVGLSFWLSASAWADGMTLGEITSAAQRSGDKSRQALVAIYGNVVNNPLASGGAGGGDTILASIFQVTNGALLVIAAFLACYIIFRKASQTAHDGSVFDREKHTMWEPIRLVWGLASLVPTANGWSLAQLLMLWAASLMGVGIANLGTDAAVAALENGQSMVVQPVMPSTVNLARSVFEVNLCMHGINAGLAQAEADGALVPDGGYVQQVPTDKGFVAKNASFRCGGAEINGDLGVQKQSTSWLSSTIDTSDLRNAHLQALGAMQTSLTAAAQNFVNAVVQKQDGGAGALPDTEVAIQSAAAQYENTISGIAATKQGNVAELAGQLSASIKDGGWWMLGAWYQTFSWSISTRPDAELVNSMLDAAIETVASSSARPVVHSDRGAHYRWPGWLTRIADAKLVRSMSRKGYSPDNAACEGFFGRLKTELFYPRSWQSTTIEQFIQALDSYIRWYNEKRIKISLGSQSPLEYRRSLGIFA